MGEAARKKRNGRDLALSACVTRVAQAIAKDDSQALAAASAELARWQVSIFDIDLHLQAGVNHRTLGALSLAAVMGAVRCSRWLVDGLASESVAMRNFNRAKLFEENAMDAFESPLDAKHEETLDVCACFVASAFEEDAPSRAAIVRLHEEACEFQPRFAAFLAGYMARAEARELASSESILGGQREAALRL